MKREVFEETGIKLLSSDIKNLRGVIIEDFDDDNKLVIAVFSCNVERTDIHLNLEYEEYEWISAEKLLKYKLGRVLKSLQHILV